MIVSNRYGQHLLEERLLCVCLDPAMGVIRFAHSSVSHGCFAGVLFQCFQLTGVVIHAAVCLPVKQAGSFSPSPAGLSFLLMPILMGIRKLNVGKLILFGFKW